MHHLWELPCLRCRRRGLAGTLQRCHREQARSHRWGPGTPRIQLVMHYLWELACLRCRRRGLAGTPQRCHREQARSHRWGAGKPRIQLVMHYLWEQACLRCRRRGLAGAPQRCHREQARSHKGSWQATNSVGHALPVGAGLPAMQTARTGRYTVAMPSRAGPLPQGGAFGLFG